MPQNKLIISDREGGKELSDTLLKEFIGSKLDEYDEPKREGTPKGDAIGFSRKKYCASLTSLYNIGNKQIAGLCKSTDGTVRVWKTQDDFKEMVQKHQEEFAEIFVKHLIEIATDMFKDYPESPYDTITHPFVFASLITPPLLWEEIEDLYNYTDELKKCILFKLYSKLRISNNYVDNYVRCFIKHHLIKSYIPDVDEKIEIKSAEENILYAFSLAIANAIDLLDKEIITDEDKYIISNVLSDNLVLIESLLIKDPDKRTFYNKLIKSEDDELESQEGDVMPSISELIAEIKEEQNKK